jgi:hypothetical protein
MRNKQNITDPSPRGEGNLLTVSDLSPQGEGDFLTASCSLFPETPLYVLDSSSPDLKLLLYMT